MEYFFLRSTSLSVCFIVEWCGERLWFSLAKIRVQTRRVYISCVLMGAGWACTPLCVWFSQLCCIPVYKALFCVLYVLVQTRAYVHLSQLGVPDILVPCALFKAGSSFLLKPCTVVPLPRVLHYPRVDVSRNLCLHLRHSFVVAREILVRFHVVLVAVQQQLVPWETLLHELLFQNQVNPCGI